MAEDARVDPQSNPHTGRSRSSTLSGSFSPITPNPRPTQQQQHERRASFLGSLLGFSGGPSSFASAPPRTTNANVAMDGSSSTDSTPWGSPASSVAESDETAPTTVSSHTETKPMDMLSASVGPGSSPAMSAPANGGGGLIGFGSWGRAATWMADKSSSGAQEAPAAPAHPRRMSTSTAFRRPFEMYSSYNDDSAALPPTSMASSASAVDSGFSPLSRVLSAPSAPDHQDGLDRGRPSFGGSGWWGAERRKSKRKLSPMGERMIRGDVVH